MPAATPEELFLEYLDRRESDPSLDFEALCAAHPAAADELRSLHRVWQLAQGALTEGEASLADKIRAQFGPDADPKVSLDERDASSDRAQVAEIAARGPQSARYQLEGEVAKGGMGAILRVFDRDLRRRLAMKVMLGDKPSPTRLSRFLEEAQVTGQLDHPGIVPVHELGVDSNGRVFFTMKLVKGITLESVFAAVRTGKDGWSVTRALSVILRVCEAMAFAHDKGVIHRDLKPLNVMVGRFGETYVMDWGIARVAGQEDRRDIRIRPHDDTPSSISTARGEQRKSTGESSSLLTMDGDQIGTPAYMPPEQAFGHLDRIGPHSDVYSVGCMLYHLLTGRVPYVEPDETVAGRVILERVLEGPPPRLESIARAVPAELVAICEKAMARDPAARYASMTALSDDLRAYLEGRVVHAYETGALAELKKWVRRNRSLATAAAVAIVAIAGAGLVQYLRRAEVAERKAEFDQLAGKVYLERAIAAQDALWPASPAQVPALERWLSDDWARLDRLRPTLTATIAQLETRDANGQRANDAETESQHVLRETLARLLADIGTLESGAKASVERRLAWARRIGELSAHHPRARVTWDEARAAIAASERYRDDPVDLHPQVGLVPLGMNPVSGLAEFYDLRSACDLVAGTDPASVEIPALGADGSVTIREATGIVFVLVPGGTFVQGAQRADEARPNFDRDARDDERPQEVALAPFFIARHELTKGQWRRLTDGSDPSYYLLGPPYDGDPLPISLAHPVEQVEWTEADRWMRRSGFALPTEAQWERAARAGTTTPWWCGKDAASLDGVANVLDIRAEARFPGWGRHEGDFDDGFYVLAPVGRFRMNAFGLFDVHGNVWEWCRDVLGAPFGTPADVDGLRTPKSEDVRRVIRGGAFNDPSGLARSASRDGMPESARTPALGLRAARALEPHRE